MLIFNAQCPWLGWTGTEQRTHEALTNWHSDVYFELELSERGPCCWKSHRVNSTSLRKPLFPVPVIAAGNQSRYPHNIPRPFGLCHRYRRDVDAMESRLGMLPSRTRLEDPTMNIPQLPIELIDEIASSCFFAGADEPDCTRHILLCMSLVCHAWRPTVCSYLYRQVVKKPDTLHQLSKVSLGNPGHGVARYIRSLCVCTSEYRRYGQSMPLPPISILHELLPNLPQLQSLELIGYPFTASLKDPPPLRTLLKLSLLHLQYIPHPHGAMPVLGGLIALLGQFESIGTLKLDYPFWMRRHPRSLSNVSGTVEAAMDSRAGVLRDTKIKSIVIKYVDAATYPVVLDLEIFRRLPHVASLENISVPCRKIEEFLALCMLWQVATSILHLDFDISEDLREGKTSPSSVVFGELILKAQTNLRRGGKTQSRSPHVHLCSRSLCRSVLKCSTRTMRTQCEAPSGLVPSLSFPMSRHLWLVSR